MPNTKQKLNKVKSVKAWKIEPDLSDLDMPLEVFESKKIAEKMKAEREARLFGLECLFDDFISYIRVIPCLITFPQLTKKRCKR
jgi:hypothetical protein